MLQACSDSDRLSPMFRPFCPSSTPKKKEVKFLHLSSNSSNSCPHFSVFHCLFGCITGQLQCLVILCNECKCFSLNSPLCQAQNANSWWSTCSSVLYSLENYFPFGRLLNEVGDLVYCIFHNLDTFDYILNCKVQSMSIKGVGMGGGGGAKGAVAPSSQLLGGPLPPSLYILGTRCWYTPHFKCLLPILVFELYPQDHPDRGLLLLFVLFWRRERVQRRFFPH